MQLKADRLYQEILLSHARRPCCRDEIAAPSVSRFARNPLCGDDVRLQARWSGAVLAEIGCKVQGCSILTASASILCSMCEGRSRCELQQLCRDVLAMLGNQGGQALEALGEAKALAEVCAFPSRLRCAGLPWEVMAECLAEP